MILKLILPCKEEMERSRPAKSMEYEDDIQSKYGSIINAPISIGPCKKYDPPIIGNKNALVLLAEFNDVKHSHEPSEFNDLLFNKTIQGKYEELLLRSFLEPAGYQWHGQQ